MSKESKTKRPFWERVARWAYPSIFELEAATRIEREKLLQEKAKTEVEVKYQRDRFWKQNEEMNVLGRNMLDLKQTNDDLEIELKELGQKLVDLRPAVEAEVKAAIAEANKPKWREHLLFIFDREGHQYSRFDSAVNLPLSRQVHMQQALRDHEMKLSAPELGILLKIIEDSLEKSINETGKDGKLRMQHLKTAGFAIQEIQNRKDQQIFSPSIIAEICAITIIRDDEDPAVIDPAIHAEKVNGILHRWGGDEDFFPLAGVDSLINQYEQSKPVWKGLWAEHLKLEKNQLLTYNKIAEGMQSTTTTKT